MDDRDGRRRVETAGRAAGLADDELRELALDGGDRALVQSLAIKMARDVRRDHHRRSVRRLGLHVAAWTLSLLWTVLGPTPTWSSGLLLAAWAVGVAIHGLRVRANAPPADG